MIDDTLKVELAELTYMANSVLGFPLCDRPCSHGGGCSLDRGHDGPHSASNRCEWTGDSGYRFGIDHLDNQWGEIN